MPVKTKEKYPELPNHAWGRVLLDLVEYVRSLEKVIKNIDSRLSIIEDEYCDLDGEVEYYEPC
jgi:hypothetical protein